MPRRGFLIARTTIRLRVLRLVRGAFRAVASSPLGPLVRHPALEPIRSRLVTVRMGEVLEVLDALRAAEVEVWLAGGWGTDALVGRQTRRHGDLDLVCALADETRARDAIEAAGYPFDYRHILPGVGMPIRVVMRDDAGRTVDLHPVALDAPPFSASADGEPFVVGTLDGRPVGCLSAPLQVALRQGHPGGDSDRRDIAQLGGNPGIATPGE